MMGVVKNRLRRLQNERGAAFLMTMLVVGSVMIFVSFLMSQTQTVSRQAHTTSERLEAQLAAEAGVDHYSKQLRTAVDATTTGDVMDVPIPAAGTHELSPEHGFTIENVSSVLNGERLTVTFTSTGNVKKASVSITKQTTIDPSPEPEPTP